MAKDKSQIVSSSNNLRLHLPTASLKTVEGLIARLASLQTKQDVQVTDEAINSLDAGNRSGIGLHVVDPGITLTDAYAIARFLIGAPKDLAADGRLIQALHQKSGVKDLISHPDHQDALSKMVLFVLGKDDVNVKEWIETTAKEGVFAQVYSIPKPSVKPVKVAGNVAVDSSVTIKFDHHEKKVLPDPTKRNVLITSALPYVNNVPHLGNIIGSVLSADVFARYCRLRGYNTLFVCGTDEYGTATETKALEEKVTPKELCDKYHALHAATYKWFDIDFNHFGRTTTPAQTTICQDIFLKAHDNGYTLEDTMVQLYCTKCERFLADRFVEGTCPNCGFNDARGDQCDNCQKLLNVTELIEPRCKLDGTTPETRESRHIFMNLTKLQPWNEEWFAKVSEEGKWSANGKSLTLGWFKRGLEPRCITRDLKWGVPVPLDGFRDKVFYVWFDAPIGYISITANYTDEWEKWWKNPDQVKLYQFMGKDNVPFHSVMFPGYLKASGDAYTLVSTISTCDYLNYESGKFSKSRGIGVFGNNVMESGVPAAVWRYYLLANRPETGDSQFTWKDFILRNNGELLANLGNFVNRSIKFLVAKYDSVVPEWTNGPAETSLIEDVNAFVVQYIENMELQKERQGLKLVMDISARGNLYLQDNKLDNNLFGNQKDRCDAVIANAINLSYLLSALLYPFMPTTTESILRQLATPSRGLTDAPWNGRDILPGHVVGKPEYLFTRIDEAREEELRKKYGGQGGSAVEEKDNKKKKVPPKVLNLPRTPEVLALEEQIKVQGDLVRLLKTDKAEKAEIDKAVATLLELKKELSKHAK